MLLVALNSYQALRAYACIYRDLINPGQMFRPCVSVQCHKPALYNYCKCVSTGFVLHVVGGGLDLESMIK